MLDKHYTPAFVAAAMMDAVLGTRVESIADFAAGHGELLRQAAQRWPNARIFANDLDPGAVRHLRRGRAHWVTSRSDFFDADERTNVLGSHVGCIDLILLNPPFSCRGAAVRPVIFRDLTLRCSTALAFIVASLPFLSVAGELIAVVPRGSLRSDKDRASWSAIASVFDIDHLQDFGRVTFPGCAVTSSIVRVRRPTQHRLRGLDGAREIDVSPILVRRGSLPVHSATLGPRRKDALPFIHSTNLRNNRIEESLWAVSERSVVTGPATLLPRVGRPDCRKVAVLASGQSVVLSDCVFALCCDSDESAAALLRKLISRWAILSGAYGGTCAPYLTAAELRNVIVKVVEDVAPLIADEKVAAER